MKRISLVFAFLLGLAVAANGQANYILELTPSADAAALAAKFQLTILTSWTSAEGPGFKVSAATAFSPPEITSIRTEPGVRDFEPDAQVQGSESDKKSKAKAVLETLGPYAFDPSSVSYYGSTVRSGYVNQPASAMIELPGAQQTYGIGSGIVAIIDTGVDPNHPALRQSLLPGYDFTRDLPGTANELADLDQSTVAILDQSTVAILDGKNYPVVLNQSTVAILDQSTVAILDGHNLPEAFGHGTMVAGLVHLVAPGALILPLKAFHADGSATLSDIVRAIRYAADYGANVISMSFTFTAASPDLQAAIQYAASKGAICVAASGNDGKEGHYYPASMTYVIGVGSINYSDRRSPFSNYDGSAVTAAPGEALVTTFPGNNYAGVWGTSFSAALVSGTAAWLHQVQPHSGYGGIMDAINAGPHIDQDMGDARLDVLKALAHWSTGCTSPACRNE